MKALAIITTLALGILGLGLSIGGIVVSDEAAVAIVPDWILVPQPVPGLVLPTVVPVPRPRLAPAPAVAPAVRSKGATRELYEASFPTSRDGTHRHGLLTPLYGSRIDRSTDDTRGLTKRYEAWAWRSRP